MAGMLTSEEKKEINRRAWALSAWGAVDDLDRRGKYQAHRLRLIAEAEARVGGHRGRGSVPRGYKTPAGATEEEAAELRGMARDLWAPWVTWEERFRLMVRRREMVSAIRDRRHRR